MTKNHKDLLANLAEQRKKKADPIVINVLLDMYQKDTPVNDADYVDRRTREVIDEMVGKMDFKSDEVITAVLALMKAMRKNWQQSLPPRREWRQKKLDLTEQRNARCEPIVYAVLHDLLKDDLILSDDEYLKEAIADQSKGLFHALLYGYMGEVFGELEISLNNSLSKANKILWQGKEKEEITSQQLDKVLKQEKLAEKKK